MIIHNNANRIGEYSTTWYAPTKATVVCPHPECSHVSDYVITKAHCRTVHNMERDQVKKLYGMPKIIRRGGL